MADPTPGRIEQLVHRLANKRLMDGQFEQCMLTLSELTEVERAITRSLAAIHHGRIAYPDDKSEDAKAQEGVPAEGLADTEEDRAAG